MKILITLLLALFISSQAYAEQTLKEHCAMLEASILNAYAILQNQPPDNIGAIKIFTMEYNKKSKIYHYLDCSDFRDDK